MALPVSLAYPGTVGALAVPSDEERQLLEMVQKERAARGVTEVRWHAVLSAIAREHAEDMAEFKHADYATPRLGTFEYRFHRSGLGISNARYAIYQTGSIAALFEDLRKTGFHLESATDIGVGIVAKGYLPRQYYVALILCERRSTLERFPSQPLLGRSYRLAGQLERGLTNAHLVVTAPNGRVTEQPLPLDGENRYDAVVAFDKGAGKYSVEVTGEGRAGPLVLDLMHCYAGVPYPPPALPAATAPTPTDLRQAERLMAEFVNRARAEARLPALAYDERLAAVARRHSEDMARGRYFAHISPTAGDLSARMAQAGLKARRFSENLAGNQSLAAAHQGLMDSPGHRRNILDPDLTHLGVGIARAESGQLLITENFREEFSTYDLNQVAGQLFRAINAARERDRVRPLAISQPLSRVALENARGMMSAGKLGYDRAKALLAQERLAYQYVQMAVFQSTDPLKAEAVTEAAKARYDEVGIGVTQSTGADGEKVLWTTVLLGEK